MVKSEFIELELFLFIENSKGQIVSHIYSLSYMLVHLCLTNQSTLKIKKNQKKIHVSIFFWNLTIKYRIYIDCIVQEFIGFIGFWGVI